MLRNEKPITIDSGGNPEKVIVYEVAVSQMADLTVLLSRLPSNAKDCDPCAMAGLIFDGGGGAASRLLHGATSLLDTIDNVGGVALMDIMEAWVEVNQPFFDRIGRMVDKLSAPAASPAPVETLPPEIKEQAA